MLGFAVGRSRKRDVVVPPNSSPLRFVLTHPTGRPHLYLLETSYGLLGCSSACGAVERSLIPDDLRGLPVWRQDIRWSLLGFALERTEGSLPGKKAVVSGRGAELPSYLDWMEVGLQVTSRPSMFFLWFGWGYRGRGFASTLLRDKDDGQCVSWRWRLAFLLPCFRLNRLQ